ncbi:MAG: DUF1697 domain-containing protein [Streptosporangiales bacterium]|nr:DUF1697 domain-containing protein [Streptosporangiales bacterium]
MPRHVLLLRGVNLGSHGKMPMADLRELLTSLRYDSVRTVLNSGNAVFTAPSPDPAAVAAEIGAAVEERFGRAVPCLVKTAGEMDAVVDGNTLAGIADNGSRLMVHFLFETPDRKRMSDLDPVTLAPGEVAVGDRVIYQWCPDGLMAAPDVSGPVQRQWGVTATTRNWNTVTRLHTLLHA